MRRITCSETTVFQRYGDAEIRKLFRIPTNAERLSVEVKDDGVVEVSYRLRDPNLTEDVPA